MSRWTQCLMRGSWAAKMQGMLTCFLFFCFKCGVAYLKIHLSLVPVLNWVLGFSGSLVSVSVIMSVYPVARCIENNIQITVFFQISLPGVSSSLILSATPSMPHLDSATQEWEAHSSFHWPHTVFCSSFNVWEWPWEDTVVISNSLMKFLLMLMENMHVVALLKSGPG